MPISAGHTSTMSAITSDESDTLMLSRIRPRSVARAPASVALPCSSKVQPCSAVKRSLPETANASAVSTCSSVRKWIERLSRFQDRAGRSGGPGDGETSTAGGTAATELTLDAVSPTGPDGVLAVTIVTAAGCVRNTVLNASPSSASFDCILRRYALRMGRAPDPHAGSLTVLAYLLSR